MQQSLEVEYWVVDAETGELAPPEELLDDFVFTDPEFVEPMVELKTPPCETVEELREAFAEQLVAVLDAADDLDKRLVPFGTPINGESIDAKPDERTQIQSEVIGQDFRYAKYCAGTHLHVEQRNVTDQLNVLLALDPALALCNSSPYFRGERVADGARAYIYRKLCYGQFPKHGQLWRYVDTVAQWHRRLERRYDEFEAAAEAKGIDADVVAEHFCPDDVVWTPVRLREEMPTVEWRSPDATLPSQTLRLAADIYDVMEVLHDTTVTVSDETGHVTEEGIVIPEFETLCDLAEAAMLDGLGSPAISEYLRRMGFDVDAYHPLSTRIDGRQYVTRSDARELRLEYADRLEADVDGLARQVEI